ncbi:MAG: hypothetical protein ACFFER_10740 [Candidatus Thorarchaeota archaeon]
MADGERSDAIDEDRVKHLVDEILNERRTLRICLGTSFLFVYAYANYLVWGYGGISGFLLNQPFDLWFVPFLHTQVVLTLLFGSLILLMIWAIK